MIEFSDGDKLDDTGRARVEQHNGQWYVLGEGLAIPSDSEEEANRTLNCIQAHGVFMNMKIFKSPGARARAQAAMADEGLKIQGSDATPISRFAYHMEMPKDVADEFVALDVDTEKKMKALGIPRHASGADMPMDKPSEDKK